MSIELAKVKKEEESSFAMEVKMPELKSKSITIDTKNTNMDKPKKKEIKKKKEEKKFFFEVLAETWEKGILNRGHTGAQDDGPNAYYCPICCVSEYFGIIPKIRLEEQKRGRVYHTPTHEEMVQMLKSKVKFIDHDVTVEPKHNHKPIPSCFFSDYYNISERNEPMLAFALASSLVGYMNNGEIAQDIKEQLYDHKQLPKEVKSDMLDMKSDMIDMLGSSNVWENPPSLKFHTTSNLSLTNPMDRFIIINDPNTGRPFKQNTRTGEISEL